MADLFISRAKTKIEVITIRADFSHDLQDLETISSQVCTCSVFSGDDANPADLLYEVAELHNNWIWQRVKEGIPGVTYNIVFTTTLSSGRIVEKVVRLAILPLDSGALPEFIPHYFTTTPYPYIMGDSQKVTLDDIESKLFLQPTWKECIKASLAFTDLSIYGGSVEYEESPEGITGLLTISGISVYGGSVLYSYGPEGITGLLTLTDIFIYGGATQYTIGPEGLTGLLTLTNISVT